MFTVLVMGILSECQMEIISVSSPQSQVQIVQMSDIAGSS